MKQFEFCEIIENKKISSDIFDMKLKSEKISELSVVGQFIDMHVGDGEHLLPRPLSICEINKEEKTLRIVYQIKGSGTKEFSKMKIGEKIKVIGPIGNGFNILSKRKIAIAGGGVGVPPLLELSKEIIKQNNFDELNIYLGFRDEVYLKEDFESLAKNNDKVKFYIATDSGSNGFKGNIISLINDSKKVFDVVYACGPKPMLKAISSLANEKNIPSQVSVEERMACGVGVCLGCVVRTKDEEGIKIKKVCQDGPVFDGREVIWDE